MSSKAQPSFSPHLAKGFIHDDFLLQTDFGKALYHNYAKDLPIIDYHNHLPPEEIATNKQFETISEIWLKGDHYKWRAMRTLGINEKYITGDASDQDKFQKWGETVPYTVRNPLFHWTQLELKRYFDIDELLSGQNANELYRHCNAQLQQNDSRVLGLLQQMKVQAVCTTDDPTDNLEHHSNFRETGNDLKLLPSFRPDKAFAVQSPEKYLAYLEVLGQASGKEINSYADLLQTLQDRIEFFHNRGCRVADHGVEKLHSFQLGDFDIELLFTKLYEGTSLDPKEVAYFSFETLVHLGRMYHKAGWVQQFHLGALRNTNQRMLSKLGPDTGFDSIGDFSQASALAGYFDLLDSTDQLTKTVIYNLNPADNEVFAAMIGNYNDGSVRAKMQFGSAWWFLDQKDGMEKQLNSLSNIGLLSCFIGMLTDSRSFLSFPRHEYFRRILCNLIGRDVENGELPADEKWLGKILADVCYHNAKAYFDFF